MRHVHYLVELELDILYYNMYASMCRYTGMRHAVHTCTGGTAQSSGGACQRCSQEVSPPEVPQGPGEEAPTPRRGTRLPGEEDQVGTAKEDQPRGQRSLDFVTFLNCEV